MRTVIVFAEEPRDGTLSDGSLSERIRELVLAIEAQILVAGLSRSRKPVVAIKNDCPGRGVHLHAGFLAVPFGSEIP